MCCLFFNFTQFVILENLSILDLKLSGVKGLILETFISGTVEEIKYFQIHVVSKQYFKKYETLRHIIDKHQRLYLRVRMGCEVFSTRIYSGHCEFCNNAKSKMDKFSNLYEFFHTLFDLESVGPGCCF